MRTIILAMLAVLVSCQKDDISKSLVGTEWVAQNELSWRSEIYEESGYVNSEGSTVYDITLRFISETKGSVKTISVSTIDGIKGKPNTSEVTFTYIYDSDFMRGSSVYDIEGMHLTSTFEIRSGFLYEESDFTGGAEYRKK